MFHYVGYIRHLHCYSLATVPCSPHSTLRHHNFFSYVLSEHSPQVLQNCETIQHVISPYGPCAPQAFVRQRGSFGNCTSSRRPCRIGIIFQWMTSPFSWTEWAPCVSLTVGDWYCSTSRKYLSNKNCPVSATRYYRKKTWGKETGMLQKTWKTTAQMGSIVWREIYERPIESGEKFQQQGTITLVGVPFVMHFISD